MKDIVIVDPNKLQLKGNIHMHSTISDGKHPAAEIAEKYRAAGYDFIMISDHEIYWNSTELDREGFLVLGGTETALLMNEDYRWIIDYHKKNGTERTQHKHMHYCCIKDESLEDKGQFFEHGYHVPRMLDRGIDSWNQQVAYMREHGNIVIINHPHWSRLAPELLLASQGVTAFEIWNSGDVVKCGGRTDEEIWDYCLRYGKRILAVAADDAHEATTDFAAGFTMVQSDEFTKASICRSFKAGSFYASCGPIVKEMRIENGTLYMRFTPVRHVKMAAYDPDGANFMNEDGSLFESLEWKINTSLRYFRPVLVDAQGREAWCQPVFVEDLI